MTPPPLPHHSDASSVPSFALTVAILLSATSGWVASTPSLHANEPASLADQSDPSVIAGHSYHGEVFNEGPRQAARKMEGLAEITFPTSAKSPETQSFIEQGIAQLHGFWYLEAERSFRQATALEPELAIAYWGCAMANINHRERANGFIEEAMKRREKETSDREKRYIESLAKYLKATEDKPTPADEAKNDAKTDTKGEKQPDKRRDEAEGASKREVKRKAHEAYIADLERIIDEFPDDIEAKAFLVLQLWLGEGDGVSMPSRYAVNALMSEIFAIAPMHPAHHYRIHLWDGRRPENALDSAAKAGPSMPGVAHMWHMPGHTYSRLHRYADAVWQQEASARVDHASMIESRLLPDQIHNFAHNNEWMVRNLLYLGRVQDAIGQSKNLLAMPRHPLYNTYAKGSYRFGRERLLQTYRSYGLWDELISDASGPYYAAMDDVEATEERDAWLAVAHFMVGNRKEGGRRLRSLQRTSLELRQQILDAADLASADSSGPNEKGEGVEGGDGSADEAAEVAPDEPVSTDKSIGVDELKRRVKRLGRLTACVSAAAAAVRGDAASVEKHAKLADLDRLMQSQWLARAKNFEAAQKLAEDVVRGSRGEVLPLAVLTHILWQRDNKEEAKKRFEELRKVAHSADLDTPVLAAVAPVAAAAGVEGDWRIELPPASDIGQRPPLEELGPASWRPFMAEPLIITTPEGVEINGDAWEGKPRIIIFYLGAGCLHCVEQLQAFAPRLDEFRAAGIDVFGISNEKTELLKKGLALFDSPMPIPLYSDPEQMTFMSYRCWDDFESVPLHGTFLVDAQGRVRWHDIGSNPFTDVDFLLLESKRLLSLPE